MASLTFVFVDWFPVVNNSGPTNLTGSGVASWISGGDIFIYSCSAQLISFEIDCFWKEI